MQMHDQRSLMDNKQEQVKKLVPTLLSMTMVSAKQDC